MFADRSAEPDEGGEPAARETGEQPIDQFADRLDGEAFGEDRSDHLLHRPGARDLSAGGTDRGEGGALCVGELRGVLQQRPAVVLELLGGGGLAVWRSSFQCWRRTSSSALVANWTT